jgi:hypothetical protein
VHLFAPSLRPAFAILQRDRESDVLTTPPNLEVYEKPAISIKQRRDPKGLLELRRLSKTL